MLENFMWDPDLEDQYLSVVETVKWLKSNEDECPSEKEVDSYASAAGNSSNELFCPDDLIQVLTDCKRKLFSGTIQRSVVNCARMSSNPFELIGRGMFLNRSAMKMANIDAAFDFMFTGHEDSHSTECLCFADICGGPGGFSEYILWRTQRNHQKCKGFGITLKGELDFKLDKILDGYEDSFEVYYGNEGDGNIYSPGNLSSFRHHVLTQTSNQGVHFVVADGSFSIEGEQHVEMEVLHQRLYLCQFIAALSVLKTRGHFLCKLFDTFTPFTVSLIYLMYRCFDSICLFKPNTSRPATSEKYLVCKGKKSGTDPVLEYLCKVNTTFDLKEKRPDVIDNQSQSIDQVLSLKLVKNDTLFCSYVYESNVTLVKRQMFFLDKMYRFSICPSLQEPRQRDYHEQCLMKWKLPKRMFHCNRQSKKSKKQRLQ